MPGRSHSFTNCSAMHVSRWLIQALLEESGPATNQRVLRLALACPRCLLHAVMDRPLCCSGDVLGCTLAIEWAAG